MMPSSISSGSPAASRSKASWKIRSPTSTASSAIIGDSSGRASPASIANARRVSAIWMLCSRPNWLTAGLLRPRR